MVQVGDIDVVLFGVDAGVFADSVFECGLMCLKATWVQARTASRIASDRETCSCSARAFNAASNAASIRTGTTAPGPTPRVCPSRSNEMSISANARPNGAITTPGSPSTSATDLPARGELSGIVRNRGGPTYDCRRSRRNENWWRVRASRGRYRAGGLRVLN